MKPYTSDQPAKCANSSCGNYARFKSEDGKLLYCENYAKNVLRTNVEELLAVLIRFINSERSCDLHRHILLDLQPS
jgi:hypothetical protein